MTTWADIHHDFQKSAFLGLASKVMPVMSKIRGLFGRKPPVAMPVRPPNPLGSGSAAVPAVTTSAPVLPTAGAAAKAAPDWSRRINMAAGTTMATHMAAGTIGNIWNAKKNDAMMERGIRDHVSGVADGLAQGHQMMAALPWYQRMAYAMAPQKVLNSRTVYDQLQSKANSLPGEVRHYMPGFMERFYAQAQPGAKPLQGPMPGAKELAVYNLDSRRADLEKLRQEMRQEQEALARQAAANQ